MTDVNVETIVFDLDGTLITCKNRQMSLLASLIKKYNQFCDTNKVWELKRSGLSTIDAMRIMGFGKYFTENIVKQWYRCIESPYWLKYDQCFSDTKLILNKLRQSNHRLILLTARQMPVWLHQQLQQLGLSVYWQEILVVNPNNADAQKTEYLKKVNPKYFIGDSEVDANAARATSVPLILLTRGQRSEDYLKQFTFSIIKTNLLDCEDELLLKQLREG